MLLLAQQTSSESFRFNPEALFEGVPLALLGISVVFAALILVSTFIAVLPRAIAVLPRAKEFFARLWPQRQARPATVAPPPEQSAEVPEEILVVIAAAAAEALGAPHRIVHARELTPEDIAWSLEGRMQLHTSHRVRRKS